jgi:putative membrane protein
VYELEVHTAGSATKVGIKAISQQLALQLKSRLLENESLQQEAEEEVVSSRNRIKGIDSKPFIKNKFLSLLKV